MSFFRSLFFWNGNEKSFKANITNLQIVLPRYQTYDIRLCRRSGGKIDALKHGT